jgi:hypothetical protein
MSRFLGGTSYGLKGTSLQIIEKSESSDSLELSDSD